jgi:outer membrane receptor for ferrienterochelin and colicins
MKFTLLFFILCVFSITHGQKVTFSGYVKSEGKEVTWATVALEPTSLKTHTDSVGFFSLNDVSIGTYKLKITATGYKPFSKPITIAAENKPVEIELTTDTKSMDEVVVTGTLKEVRKAESPVPVEVYTPAFFKKNPTPHIFDALQQINGVRPQLNCNVCNTGDIHMNGLEGPYTMVLIDGMPIVSGLATVYGLSGIPSSLIERIEIVKGPASSLYGSEAVGGLINVITKKPDNAPLLSISTFATSWKELNADIGIKVNAGSNASALTGINYFTYNHPYDKNRDQFTDVTLQQRLSIFQKWSFKRFASRLFTMGARYYTENRWGGDMRWNQDFKGSDSIYGESIDTKRWELIGAYQLPVKEKLMLSYSYTYHNQHSYYGHVPYFAKQQILFSQLTWDKKINNHDLLVGAAFRYTFYDDNTPVTAQKDSVLINKPDKTALPGVFIQDEISLSEKHKILLGLRYDHHSHHGNIYTPRFAYKWTPNEKNIFRLNAGTGFRVVNLFTEEHAALTGAREIILQNELKPERSYNVNLNYIKKIIAANGNFIGIDASAWYTFFNNRILANYDADPNSIIYDNLSGHAITKGISTNLDISLQNGLKIMAGGTLMHTYTVQKDALNNTIKTRPVLTEKWTGTWSISYKVHALNVLLDYTGNIYGPMRLPLLGALDPRRANSPIWSLQNIQFTWGKPNSQWEIYGGVKNLLNWTPAKNNAFLIARAHDPFDKNVQFDNSGKVIPTSENPYALTFDPTYVYAPNQGIRAFLGMRMILK